MVQIYKPRAPIAFIRMLIFSILTRITGLCSCTLSQSLDPHFILTAFYW